MDSTAWTEYRVMLTALLPQWNFPALIEEAEELTECKEFPTILELARAVTPSREVPATGRSSAAARYMYMFVA